MSNIFLNTIFKNTGDLTYNDVVHPEVLDLSKGTYSFTLIPRTAYWRFGIRLSQSPTIDFFHPSSRYKSPEFQKYKDIHLAAGELLDANWTYPTRLQLVQYNFEDLDHVLTRFNTVDPASEIEWTLECFPEDNLIALTISMQGRAPIISTLSLTSEYKYFKIFAWADSVDFEISVLGKILDGDTEHSSKKSISSFQVGKILFRLGDLFDSEVIGNSKVFILPASSSGTASSNIRNRASELGIPYPPPHELGSILLYTLKERDIVVAYAYSVENDHSNLEVIQKVCGSILEAFGETKSKSASGVTAVSLPLLGTGAGGLDAAEVAEIYDQVFNTSEKKILIQVSVLSSETFKRIKDKFNGRFIPLKKSFDIKPQAITNIERLLGRKLEASSFRIDETQQVSDLILNDFSLSNDDFLTEVPNLKSLSINNSTIKKIQNLPKLKNLSTLIVTATGVENFEFVHQIKNLRVLNLNSNGLTEIQFLTAVNGLQQLYLSNNMIGDIAPLSSFRNLEVLDVSNNHIKDISVLKVCSKLERLDASSNVIESIAPCRHLSNLQFLSIRRNSIKDIAPLKSLKKLFHLRIDSNPFLKVLELVLKEDENHLPTINNFLLRQNETNKEELRLPCKVLLLGNHASGKSSLLQLITKNVITNKPVSTHIIKIEKFFRASVEMIPHAIFFDFGGQDYYHGIYRAFLSSGCVYLITWRADQNINVQRKDSNGILTQDFTLNYWLNQKKFLEKESGDADQIILIQSHADQSKKIPHGTSTVHSIENDFFVSLAPTSSIKRQSKVNHYAQKYLRESILEIIETKKTVRQEPKWYVSFLKYILQQNSEDNHRPRPIAEVLKHYKRNRRTSEGDILELLKDDLDQLNKRGLVLYYKKKLPDVVWLNPTAFVKYVHDNILSHNSIKERQGKVPVSILDTFDKDVVNLLNVQKVLFKHDFGEQGPEFIVPNFLPLSNESDAEFQLSTFELGEPLFWLKFQDFLPFGLINQMICFFGKLPSKKKFWRDQMIFILENKVKVLIQIDASLLEIRVYGAFVKGEDSLSINETMQYLFYGIMALYWDLHLLEFKDFVQFMKGDLDKKNFEAGTPMYSTLTCCEDLFEKKEYRPLDLHISRDGKAFANYNDLYSDDSAFILGKLIDDKRILGSDTKLIPSYQFQPFIKKKLKRQKKAVISYSKKDLKLVNKFKDYLIPLHHDELIENPWYCTELIAGTDWNNEIQTKFDEADIIFFMVSENLMASRYVLENEIKKAIDRWGADKSLKIIPVILVHYHWHRSGEYDLSKFAALPYTAKPITDFADQNLAWYSVSESIRMMIERDMNSEDTPELSKDLKNIYERLVGGSLNR